MTKRTKIVTTIGPASDTPEKMRELLIAGANVFRFNMKHGTVEWHEERIARADSIAKEMGLPLGILVDLQGPEIRLETRDKKDVPVKKGEQVNFHLSYTSPEVQVILPHPGLFSLVKVGDELLIDDGFQEFDIVSVEPELIVASPREDYSIHHRKGVNFPGLNIDMPSLIDADLDKLDLATRTKVDFIGLSFCRSKEDLDVLRAEMHKRNLHASIIAKVESKQALDNFDEILESADAVMVARGDLGVETPIEELAFWQKQLIYRCRTASKPVIVATQMLQSMTDLPRPTRAEATDISNAVWDGTDAIMLSAETASGKFPIKAVEVMAKIAIFNEANSYVAAIPPHADNQTEAIVAAAMKIVTDDTRVTPNAILVFTSSGRTARVVSSYRPDIPIIAISDSQKTVEELSLCYGVVALLSVYPIGEYRLPTQLMLDLKAKKLLMTNEIVLVLHGQNWHEPGSTNSLAIITV